MARIEKTVFISYRRTDVYTALAVYENLKNQSYDVFFDYRSISSGDFEQIITSNIRARAHFLLILTPTALDRCNEPGDWLRREIEVAIDEKRNIVPLFFRGFRFGDPSVTEKLTGKLKNLSRYNGMNVHEDFFDEAMYRLRTQYLNIPLNTVLHPVSTEVQQKVIEQQVAADKALEKIEDVKEHVKQTEDKPDQRKAEPNPERQVLVPAVDVPVRRQISKSPIFSFKFRLVSGIAGGAFLLAVLIWGGIRFSQNQSVVTPNPTLTFQIVTTQSSQTSATDMPSLTETIVLPTLAPKALGTSISTSSLSINSTETAGTPVQKSTLSIGSTVNGKDDMTLLYVPEGDFKMGSDTANDEAEKPAHVVYLDAFWIDQTEVTNKMYSLCVSAGRCKEPLYSGSYTLASYYGNSEYDHFPVIYVDWNMAKNYCEWVDRRLPTEAEWEKAASWDAKNQTKYAYPWGNSAPNKNLLNYNKNIRDTTEVGTYPNGASPYGALDMAGNVWEWVNDWTSDTYYQNSPSSNPSGPTSGQSRALRGGDWEFTGNEARSANRGGQPPIVKGYGIRCGAGAP